MIFKASRRIYGKPFFISKIEDCMNWYGKTLTHYKLDYVIFLSCSLTKP